VGTRDADGRIVLLPLGPPAAPPSPKEATTLKLVAKLKDVEVKRDTTMKVKIVGETQVDVGEKTSVTGQIHLPEGFIEIQGKRFKIEKANVTFNGDPTNPTVIATAVYTAPDVEKTVVYADFVGPVKTGKLSLRSEPSHSSSEIMALLLFGSADGYFGKSSQGKESDAAKAAGLAGGVVTEGLNKAISGVTSVEITTKVDTEQDNNPRPEVEVQLSREVSASIIRSLGVPPPGQSPDTTMVLVDWRFVKNWSADVTLGDKGTSILDFTWKYRY
jgi:translocation and assembly module TamB